MSQAAHVPPPPVEAAVVSGVNGWLLSQVLKTYTFSCSRWINIRLLKFVSLESPSAMKASSNIAARKLTGTAVACPMKKTRRGARRGQSLPIDLARTMSALPPTAEVSLRRGKCRNGPTPDSCIAAIATYSITSAAADEQVLVTGSGTPDGYFPRACWSNTLSTASVMASTPVSIVGFGTGANKGEWLAGNCGPSRAAATRSGS